MDCFNNTSKHNHFDNAFMSVCLEDGFDCSGGSLNIYVYLYLSNGMWEILTGHLHQHLIQF